MRSALLAAALAALLAAACRAPHGPPPPLSTDIFEDVVAPRAATYLENKSFSYRTPTFRCGRFSYDWLGAEADAVRFYMETMAAPPYSWAFTGEDRFQEGSTRLFFSKGDDRCVVDIDRVPKPGIERRNNLSLVVRVNYHK
jgi:hypothetical protein